MKMWTKDNRPLVWTANENWTNTLPLYDLYIHGVCVGEAMDFDAFYTLYNSYRQKGL